MKLNIILSAFLVLIILLTERIIPQSETGTTIGQFLKIEPSSRSAAMGTAGAALYGEASSAFFNPASLGRISGNDAQFTFNKWIADITYNYAGAVLKVEGVGNFSLQFTSLNSGEIDVRTVDQPLGTGEKYSVTDFAIGLGYGFMLTDRVSAGVVVNYINETIWHSSLNGFALNFGIQYQIVENGPTIGASVSNFGPYSSYNGRDLYLNYDANTKKYGDNDMLPAEYRTDSYSWPTIFRVGFAYPINFDESTGLLIAADAIHPNDNKESINVGGELKLLDHFSLRGGYRNFLLKESVGGFTLGAGVNVDFLNSFKVRFDYAWADYGILNQAHRVTISIGF
jgi:opacity protein-like surface antigen